MKIPYVIDNIEHRLADVLNGLLQAHQPTQLSIATAYFTIRGYQQVQKTLPTVQKLRLLLGDNPQSGEKVGLKPDSAAYLRREINAEPLSLSTQELVEDLIRLLRRPEVEVRLYLGYDPAGKGRRQFLHAKCYLFYEGGSSALSSSLFPLVGIVGSSNFTAPGLVSNRELNLVHKTLLEPEEVNDATARAEVAFHAQSLTPVTADEESQRLLKSEVGTRAIMELSNWYDEQWQLARDYKQELIELLESSKFGGREYTPYEIYMKALYEYFRDDLDDENYSPYRSAVELSEFQADAVKKARRILARYDGVIVADSVGLGKTWIGKKLLEEYAYHQRQKAVVICPAALIAMWQRELQQASIAATVISQERLAQDEFEGRELFDADVLLVDEAHNFRNRRTKRYEKLETILAGNGRRGKQGGRKKLILLTATPINNNIFDLYNQINLFAGNDRTYFLAAGIGDLYKYFLAARRESIEQGSIRIFNLLEEVVVRRTRQFIRRAYPEAMINGQKIKWPERVLHTVEYDLEAAYKGIYQEMMSQINRLTLGHYNLESYKLVSSEKNDLELGRQMALVGIFKSRFLKRLESSIDAFRISIHRALTFIKTFAEYVQEGTVLDASSFNSALRLLDWDGEDSEDMPRSLAELMDEQEEVKQLLSTLPRLDPAKYDRRRLHRDLAADIDSLTAIWYQIKGIKVAQDAKFQRLKQVLGQELQGQKVLIFTYYKDTARYLYRALTEEDNSAWLKAAGSPHVRRIDSGSKLSDRQRLVEHFAPVASGRPEVKGTEQEIDILISTDVLSEGQNLQDCGYLINYDLHWNPTRMVQRAGRIDRLGSAFPTLAIYNMFPEKALEELLGLVASLTAKIDTINQTGFLDASVLGEVVTPRDFNTLRRIVEEDNSVVEEQESFLELASSEALLAELQRVLTNQANKWLTDLDDGIHSGLERKEAKGIFFYYTAPHPKEGRVHFWRYYDFHRQQIVDNRYHIMQIITCIPETPRFPPLYQEMNVFEIQEKVISHILNQAEQQQAAEVMGKPVSEEQVVVAQFLRQEMKGSNFDRQELRQLYDFLKQPLVGASVQRLRQAQKNYSVSQNMADMIEVVRVLFAEQGVASAIPADSFVWQLKREELHLVCYEYVCA